MSLSQYLLRSDPFRYASLALDPVPYRFRGLSASDALFAQQEQLLSLVTSHLSQLNCDYSQCGLLQYQSMVFGDGAVHPLIRISMDSIFPRAWSDTVKSLKSFLTRNGFQNVEVEILNLQFAYQLKIYPLTGPNSQRISDDWTHSQVDVVRSLDYYLKDTSARWSTAGVFMCGQTLDKAKPTLVIKIDGRVNRKAEANWKSLELNLKQQLAKWNLSTLEVEFSYGRLVPDLAVPISTEKKVGDSIGIIGSTKSGTLGGFIGLDMGRKAPMRLFATTCRHVTRPEDRQGADFRKTLPLQDSSSIDSRITPMRSPSQTDYNDTLNALTNEMRLCDESITKIEAEREEQGGFLTPARLRQLNRERESLPRLQSQSAVLTSKAGNFGRTVCSSGIRAGKYSERMDWAMIEVPPSNFGANYPPFRNDIPTNYRPTNYNPSESPCGVIDDMRPDEWVVLKGRTSGVSTGQVSITSVVCNKWGNVDMKTVETVAIGAMQKAMDMTAFGRPGDSGAWCYNENGAIVGQQIAHEQGVTSDISVITPIRHLIEDAEDITGGKVYFPVEEKNRKWRKAL